jgi:hypothetical protein
MISRLADVLYWLGLIAAGLCMAAAIFNASYNGDGIVVFFNVTLAGAAYLTGRAFRYVLAGR